MLYRFLCQIFSIILLLSMGLGTHGQDSTFSRFPTKKWVLGGVQAGLWGGTFYSLNKTWYANYPRSDFHLYNDWKEWQQMDKAGHAWSSYQISNHTSKIWQWAGMEKKKAVLIGGISGMAYLSIIEILDGYSDKWGFSIPDVMANSAGAGIYVAQELAWNEQRVTIKLSYSPYKYGTLTTRANALFGSGDAEKVLKDYNGQSYWASVNVKSFFPDSHFPNWFNIALGYGARTMLGGYENTWTTVSGMTVNRSDIPRYKRFYLSADIDLTRIKTKNKTVKTVLSLFNVLKVPAPTIEWNGLGKLSFHPFFF
jgi:hypothetical protein